MLTIATFLWGEKYTTPYVNRLAKAVRHSLKARHRFVVITDKREKLAFNSCVAEVWPITDEYLTHIPGCFARLMVFAPEWQQTHGIDDRIVVMDLDSIVTGELDPLFDRPEDFVILQGANAHNPCPYNGSLWMLRAGKHPEVWNDFSLKAVQRIPKFQFPDDQGWFALKMPGAAGWRAGSGSGVYAFQKPGWPNGQTLPDGARLVVFPGWRDPAQFRHLDWIASRW